MLSESCWWMVRNDLADVLPERAVKKVLRMPRAIVHSAIHESKIFPSVPATSIIQDKAKKVLAFRVDPEYPESFMLRPKRRRWVNERAIRWVKSQPYVCYGKQADDLHHLTGHGQGGTGTKAHDLRCCLWAESITTSYMRILGHSKRSTALNWGLIFHFIDQVLAIGVLG